MTWDDLSEDDQRPWMMLAIVAGHKSPVVETAKFLWEQEQKEQNGRKTR